MKRKAKKKPKVIQFIKCSDTTYYVVDLSDCDLKSLNKFKKSVDAYLKYWDSK